MNANKREFIDNIIRGQSNNSLVIGLLTKHAFRLAINTKNSTPIFAAICKVLLKD